MAAISRRRKALIVAAIGIAGIVVALAMSGFVSSLVSTGLVPSDDATFKSASAPASLAGKTVFLGTDGGVYALDAATGMKRWRYPAPDKPHLRITSLALCDGTVFAATMNGPVLALRAQGGTLLWSSDVVHESNEPALACADGTVYAAAHVGTPQAESDKLLVALRADNGRELWRFSAGEPILSAPAVGSGVVLFGTIDRLLYAVDARTGALRWESGPYSQSGGGAHLEDYVHAKPLGISILVQGDTIYANAKIKHWNDAGQFYIEPDTYVRSVSQGPFGGRSGAPPEGLPAAYPPVVVDGVSYAEGGGGLWATGVSPLGDPGKGWYHNSDGTQYTGPAVGDGRVYVCAFNGYTYGLRQKDGGELWRAKTGAGELSQPPAYSDGAVIVSGASAAFALRAGDGARIWRMSTGADTIRLTPLVA